MLDSLDILYDIHQDSSSLEPLIANTLLDPVAVALLEVPLSSRP